MRTTFLKPSDAISVLSSLLSFKTVCNSSGTDGEGATWLLSDPTCKNAETALSYHASDDFKAVYAHEDILHIYQ